MKLIHFKLLSFFSLGLLLSTNLVKAEDYFSALPEEIQVRILQFCDIPSLGNFSQVSKHGKRICEDEQVWRERENKTPFTALPSSVSSEDSNQNSVLSWRAYVKKQAELRKKVFPQPGKGIFGFLKPSYLMNKVVRIIDEEDPLILAVRSGLYGHYEEALVYFSQVPDERLEDPAVLGVLADAYYFTSQLEKAESLYRTYYEFVSKNSLSDSRLVTEVRNGDLERVELLLKCGANPNYTHRNSPNRYLLLEAVKLGGLPMVKLLVENGINLNQDLRINEEIVKTSIQDGYPEILKYLLEHGLQSF